MKKTRQLITGDIVSTTKHFEEITISTKCPDKWRFIDLETGEGWAWDTEKREFKKDDLINTMAFDNEDEN